MNGDCLFEYTIATEPNPLATNLEGVLILTAKPKNGQAIYCEYLVIRIPVGDTEEALSRTKDDVGYDSEHWEVGEGELKLGGEFWQQNFYNPTPEEPVNQFTVKIYARPVNSFPGNVKIPIIEYSKLEEEEFKQKTTEIAVIKAPEPFYLSYFTAKNPETGRPCTEFTNGSKIQLCWNGSKDNTYNLYQGNDLILENSQETSYTLENGLKRSASFVLEAKRVPGGHTYSTLGITITNPEFLEMNGGVKAGKIGERNEAFLNRGILVFSNEEGDLNHTIYNNGFNLDNEGAWDGMKMNVYKGLAVRTGNAKNQNEVKTALSVEADKTEINGRLSVKGIISGEKVIGDGIVPRGAIVMWSGNANEIPSGWVLCDGNNGTPDLRGRFIVGYSASHGDYNAVGKTGGKDAVQLTINEMPRHSHEITISGNGGHHHWIEGTDAKGLSWRPREIWGETTVDMGYGGGWNADPGKEEWRGAVNTDTCGNHSHTGAISVAGAGGSHENRPSYYVLAFIMKL